MGRGMVVYLDLIFLMNFAIDGALLQTTAWTRHIKGHTLRIILSAFIGASYVVLMFFPELSFLYTLLVKCLFSVLMIITAFGFKSLQYFMRNLLSFYVVNFVAAGGILGIHYLLQSQSQVMNGILYSQTGGAAFRLKVGLAVVLVGFAAVLFIYRGVNRSAKERQRVTDYLAEVRIYMDEVESICTGLIDTGNQLYDPLTRTPVMVMETSLWKEHLPEAWLAKIRLSEADQIVAAMEEGECRWQDRIRLVPFRGVNRGMQFMLAFKPDRVVIVHNETESVSERVLLGLDGGKLSSDGSYQAIIHPMLVSGE